MTLTSAERWIALFVGDDPDVSGRAAVLPKGNRSDQIEARSAVVVRLTGDRANQSRTPATTAAGVKESSSGPVCWGDRAQG